MDTDVFIKTLAKDTGHRPLSLHGAWRLAMALAAVLAAMMFFSILHPRPDFLVSLERVRFLFKFVFALSLCASAFIVLRRLSRPGLDTPLFWLAIAPLLLILASAAELSVVPSSEWMVRLVGSNSLICLTMIPLIGLGPLLAFLLCLRYGAPTRPTLSGGLAGVLAGSIAACFYAAHCPDDSPLFVATWYTLAIVILGLIGAFAARPLLRW